MDVKDINDSDAVFSALLRDHEELVAEVYALQERMRTLRHWARLWRAMARVERSKRRWAEEDLRKERER
jgi:uncharacterized protein with PhoU and TrkA domain